MNTSPPEREDLANFAENIESLDEVRTYFEANVDKLGLYLELIEQLLLPAPLTVAFKGSFDDEGKLNAEKYPELGRLRQQAEVLRGRIIQTIQTLLRSQEMKEKLSDK
jgi:dsDNA-specific endonuclease/ATPase MutS2